MKNYLFMVLSLLLLSGCTQTDDDKAAALVKEWLKSNVNDPSSLEIVSIAPVEADSVLDYSDDNNYKLKQEETIRAYEYATDAINKSLHNLAKEYEDKAKAAEKELKQMEDTFKPYCRGKKTLVKYRAKNGFGALMLEERSFLFDNELTKIISSN